MTKQYKIKKVMREFKDGKLKTHNGEVEFDTYSEDKAYVDEHNLVYEEPKYE